MLQEFIQSIKKQFRKMVEFFKFLKYEEDLIYIKKNIPLDLNIIIFIILSPLSFFYFFIIFWLVYFNLMYLLFKYLSLRVDSYIYNNKNILQYNYTNYKSDYSLIFWIQEFLFEYSKSKSFLILYNFLYIFTNNI